MIPGPVSVSLWALAARLADIAELSNGWQIIIVPDGEQTTVAEELATNLQDLAERPVTSVAIKSVGELEEIVQRDPADALLLLSGFASFDDEAWRAADIARARLQRRGQTLLILTTAEVARVPSLAPNLWSWVGDGAWTYVPEKGLSEEERTQRLATIRAHFGFDDDELLRRARSGTLTPDADIAEWLILLDHANLVPPHIQFK